MVHGDTGLLIHFRYKTMFFLHTVVYKGFQSQRFNISLQGELFLWSLYLSSSFSLEVLFCMRGQYLLTAVFYNPISKTHLGFVLLKETEGYLDLSNKWVKWVWNKISIKVSFRIISICMTYAYDNICYIQTYISEEILLLKPAYCPVFYTFKIHSKKTYQITSIFTNIIHIIVHLKIPENIIYFSKKSVRHFYRTLYFYSNRKMITLRFQFCEPLNQCKRNRDIFLI